MNIQTLQTIIVDALEDMKGQEITVFDTTGMTSLFDRVVIASGTSNRQTRSLANNVREKIKEAGGVVGNIEGEETGEWVLLDCIDAVVHVMQPAIRQYYRLEEIWGGKPVNVKRSPAAAKPGAKTATKKVASKTVAAAQAKEGSAVAKKTGTRSVTKATSTEGPTAKKTVTKKATVSAASKTTTEKAPRRPAAKTAVKPAAKTPVKKAAPGKVLARKPAVKAATVVAKKPAAKKVAAKKVVAKKAAKA